LDVSGAGGSTTGGRPPSSASRPSSTSGSAPDLLGAHTPAPGRHDIPAYLVGNVAKIISVAVASIVSFFLLRYVVFSRKRWFKGACKSKWAVLN
jgi:hypothetical protein